jgi:hypothetical protein
MRPAQLRYWSLCSNDPITERFFHYSIQRARYDHERADLGAYYPAIRYASAAQAERLGCHRPA